MSSQERNERKVYRGKVVSDKMDKTIVVELESRTQHPKYGKRLTVSKRYKAHDENNEASLNDIVEIMETRKISKDKNFRLIQIIEKGVVL